MKKSLLTIVLLSLLLVGCDKTDEYKDKALTYKDKVSELVDFDNYKAQMPDININADTFNFLNLNYSLPADIRIEKNTTGKDKGLSGINLYDNDEYLGMVLIGNYTDNISKDDVQNIVTIIAKSIYPNTKYNSDSINKFDVETDNLVITYPKMSSDNGIVIMKKGSKNYAYLAINLNSDNELRDTVFDMYKFIIEKMGSAKDLEQIKNLQEIKDTLLN